MQTKALIQKTVEALNKVNTVVPNLNCGGCGVFAHALAFELELKGFKPQVAVIANSFFKPLPDTFADELLEKGETLSARKLNASGADLAHLMVYIPEEGIYADSEGVYEDIKESSWSSCKHQFNLSVKNAGIIAENPEGWNSSFDRHFVPKVYDMVFKAVNKIFKNNQPEPVQLSFNF